MGTPIFWEVSSPGQRPLFLFVSFSNGPWHTKILTACQMWSRYLQPLQKYYRGTLKFWRAPLAQGHAHFYFGCDFMMGLCTPKLCTIYEFASPAIAETLLGNPNIWGVSLAQGHVPFFFWWDVIMRLGKPQLRAKFEFAGFIYDEI